jgi:undecaprenyl-diphosphatase
LIVVLAIACLLFAFGLIAQNVMEGTSLTFDQKIIRVWRDPGNPSLGPAWVQDAARDLTSLGSLVHKLTVLHQFKLVRHSGELA